MEGMVKKTAKAIQAENEFRASLWKEFVRTYQTVLACSPDTFSEYCRKFRERWVTAK
jgi:hypothetical protein